MIPHTLLHMPGKFHLDISICLVGRAFFVAPCQTAESASRVVFVYFPASVCFSLHNVVRLCIIISCLNYILTYSFNHG